MTTRAPFEAIVEYWRAFNPSFIWAPTTPDTWLLDRVSGQNGRTKGMASDVGPGGIPRTVANASDTWIEWDTAAGVTGTGPKFLLVGLASFRDPSVATGCFVKIGTSSNGIGVGAGNTTFEDAGNRAAIIREGLAWHVSASTGAYRSGGNAFFLGAPTDTGFAGGTVGASEATSSGLASVTAASSILQISGYTTNRTTNAQVHAVAVFPVSLTSADNKWQDFRAAVIGPLQQFVGRDAWDIVESFRLPRQIISVPSSASASLPTLSAPTFVGATSTSLTPRVTATWT